MSDVIEAPAKFGSRLQSLLDEREATRKDLHDAPDCRVSTAPIRRAVRCACFVVVILAAVGCQSLPIVGRGQPPDTTRLRAEEVQAEIMAFTDSYTAIVSQAIDRVARALPEHRAVLHDAQLRYVQNAITIAAGPNPIGALLDMTVMVTLQRQLAEEYWIPERFGEAARPLAGAFGLLEREIWLIAERALNEEEVKALRALIPEIRERFQGQVLVSAIRASDVAADRSTAVANLQGGGSLLRLFQIDPLAGLSPAAQELAQTRLLAERAFFWSKRLPTILNWQMRSFVLDTLHDPETRQMLDATTQMSESSRRISAAVESFADQIAAERAATLEQMNELVTAEREAALKQAFDGIAAEREAILATFENEEVRLRGLLEDVRLTVDGATSLSSSLNETVTIADRLLAGFRRDLMAPSDGRPFDIAEYQATAETATGTVRELNQMLESLESLLASPNWDARSGQIQNAAAEGRAGLEQLVDRAFMRAMIVVLTLVVTSFGAMVLYRWMFRRTG